MKGKLGTVRARLTLGFALLLAMILLLAGFVTFESYRVSQVRLERQAQAADLFQFAEELESDLLNIETGKRGFLLNGAESFLEPYDTGRRDFEGDLEAAREINAQNEGGVDTRTLDEIEAQYRDILDLFEEQIAARRAGETSPEALRLSEGKAEMDSARVVLDRLQAQAEASRQEAREDSQAAVIREAVLAVLLGTLALITVLASMLYVRRSVIRPLQELREGARRVGEGDLDHRIGLSSTDELGAVAASFNDMLDRRREAAAALAESEERFRGLSDAAFEGIAISNEEELQESNRVFAQMFGYEPEEVVGMSTLDFTLPEYHDLVRRHRVSGLPTPYEAKGLRKDGSTFDIEIRGRNHLRGGREDYVMAVRDVTERKQAEEALKRSEARIRAIVETTPDAILTMTADGIVRSFNPGAERIFGYAAAEIVGRPLRNLMPERFKQSHEEGFRRYLKTGAAHVIDKGPAELAGLRKDGTEFPLELSLGEMREEKDILFTGIVRDVTERKKAERQVREAEQRYRTLVEQLPAAIYVQDAGDGDEPGGITYMSPQVEDQSGYTPQDFLQDPELYMGIIHPEDRGRVQEEDSRTERTGEPFRMEYRVLKPDGTVVWLRDEARLILDEEGRPRFWQGFQLDVTERKKAEEELRKSEERYRILTETVQEGLAYIAPEGGVVTFCNRAYAEILGYSSPDEVVGRSFFDFVSPEDRERILDQREMRVRGVSSAYEATVTAADGTDSG